MVDGMVLHQQTDILVLHEQQGLSGAEIMAGRLDMAGMLTITGNINTAQMTGPYDFYRCIDTASITMHLTHVYHPISCSSLAPYPYTNSGAQTH